MSSKGKGTKRSIGNTSENKDEVDLFARLSTQDVGDEGDTDGDSTDSEESEYSDLDEEEDSSDDELSDVESIEDMTDSIEEASDNEQIDDDDDDGDDDEDDDDDNEEGSKENKEKNKQNEKKISKEKSGIAESEKSNVNSTKISKKKLKSKPEEQLRNDNEPTTSRPKVKVTGPDEYVNDSSDEEDLRNTVGNIPMEWYREYEHIGYNLDGKRIIKPPKGDEIDNFLNKMDNPDYWRTIVDKTTGQNVILSDKDCEMIRRFRKGKYVDSKYNAYEPWVDFFSYDTMKHPVTNRPADKRSFIPSRWERLKVGRMVHAIKMGWMKPQSELKKSTGPPKPVYYLLWKTDDETDITHNYRGHIPAPKLPLPGHEESYNPPPEYLFTEEEKLAWKDQEPETRRLNFIPQRFSSLRQVPGYNRFINDRFERCLDLYLCPRQRIMRMNVNPEDLLPKLPKPKDLQPFPTTTAIIYKGHAGIVRSISVEPSGQWLVSGSDDKTIKFWEVSTGRCMKTIDIGLIVKHVSWNPNESLCLVAVVVENDVLIINPGLGDKLVVSNTDNLLHSFLDTDAKDNRHVTWETYSDKQYKQGFRLKITHFKAVGQLSWHGRGDYLAVVIPSGDSKSVVIHQLSKRRSQHPFSKAKGLVQCVLFHPTRPFLFVATQRYVRVYNLLKQELTKKLMTNVKWVSSMAVHPGGDNVIVGSYDSKLTWFDLDLSTKPYQTLRHHKRAIRQVCYHKKYPLFASSSDDGTIIICHGRVYNDLLQNPLIVPVKVLRGHAIQGGLGVLGCEFHPTQPWVFSCGSDHMIRLYS